MENKIESGIDGILESLFGGFNPGVLLADSILGVALLILGFKFLRNKTSSSKSKFGWIFIGVGCLGILSGIIQLFNILLK